MERYDCLLIVPRGERLEVNRLTWEQLLSLIADSLVYAEMVKEFSRAAVPGQDIAILYDCTISLIVKSNI